MKPKTVDELIRRIARKRPTSAALLDEEGLELSYGALERRVNALSHRFAQEGLRPGEWVAIIARNSFAAVAAYLAIGRAGAAAVWLNHSLAAQELAVMAADSGVRFLVHEMAFMDKASKITFICGVKTLMLEDLGQEAADDFPSKAAGKDLAAIVYTSGSTDKPLGVMLTHRNFLSNNLAIADYLRLTEEDRVCCVLPLYYIYGISLLLSHFAAGGSVVLENRFSYPQAALDTIDALRATGFSGVSSHFILLMDQTDFLKRELPSVRYFTHAGDKMPVPVTQKISKAFPKKELFLMYGQTEASPRISYLEPRLVSLKPASVGRPLKNIELKIIDEKGNLCAAGVEGEIAIRGDNVMKGYWKNPEETQKVLREGWLLTGDLGFVDGEGDLFVVGRKKQFIKIGGRRVSPLEVEAMALEYPGIKEAAVIGVEDKTLGERLRLCVAAADAHEINVGALIDFYKKRAPFYKVPSEIVVLDALPRNHQGKVNRKHLANLPQAP